MLFCYFQSFISQNSLIVFTLFLSDIKTTSLCHFGDDIGARLEFKLSDAYDIALTFIVDGNSPCPEREKLCRQLVHSGQLRFVHMHIFGLPGSKNELAVMLGAANSEHLWRTFFYQVTLKCLDMKWLGDDPPSPKELMDAATVEHSRFNELRPHVTERKFVRGTSSESTVGSVLTHVTQSNKISRPNFLRITFVHHRRSRRVSAMQKQQSKAVACTKDAEKNDDDGDHEKETSYASPTRAKNPRQQNRASSASPTRAKGIRQQTSSRNKSKKRIGQKATQRKRKRKRGKEVQAQVSLKFKQF